MERNYGPSCQTGSERARMSSLDLKNVMSYSFSGNHLIEVSLVYQRQTESRKKHFFCFVKLLPGGKNGAERTYISDKHITMKLSLDKVLELAKALRAYAGGIGMRTGAYATFTDTSKASQTSENTHAGSKKLSIFYGTTPDKNNGQQADLSKIMLSMSLGSGSQTFSMSPYYAGSMADIIEKIALKGVEYEFGRQVECNRQPQQKMQ